MRRFSQIALATEQAPGGYDIHALRLFAACPTRQNEAQ
jgi:hypothetical protein